MQKLLGTNEVTEVSVRLRDDRFSATANQALTKEMGGLEVLDWRQLDPQAAAIYEIADVGIKIWYVILLLALAFGLINSLITAVLERVREFGMLRALGMRPQLFRWLAAHGGRRLTPADVPRLARAAARSRA